MGRVNSMKSTVYPNVDDQRKFWNIWNSTLRDPENLNEWCLRRRETIMHLLISLSLQSPRILDLGCGSGWLSDALSRIGPTTAIDLANDVIAKAKTRYPQVSFMAGSFFEAPLPTSHFDVVVSQEVIAHLPDQAAYIELAARVLRPGGYLIITTPNKFVMDRHDWPSQPAEHIERWLTVHSLKQLLSAHFHVTHMTTLCPLGHKGILRLVNSTKLNAILHAVMSPKRVEALKERAGYGWTIVALAEKIG